MGGVARSGVMVYVSAETKSGGLACAGVVGGKKRGGGGSPSMF